MSEEEEAVQLRVPMHHLIPRANKMRVKSPLADALFMYRSFWVFHLTGHS